MRVMKERLPIEAMCTSVSTQVREPLSGSASEASDWLLLEEPERWGAKALEESALSEPVKQRIQSWIKAGPGRRCQLIKQSARRNLGRELFVVHASAQQQYTTRWHLDKSDDLLDIDFEAEQDVRAHTEPLWLVCTNGKRDACCSKWGFELYQSLAVIAPQHVWQTSHLGGHRFAATAVCVSSRIYHYGRLTADDATALLAAHQRGELYEFDRIRGRCDYGPAAQAADIWVRREQNLRALNAVALQEVQSVDANRWHVTLSVGNSVSRVSVTKVQLETLRPASCGDAFDKPVAYEVQPL